MIFKNFRSEVTSRTKIWMSVNFVEYPFEGGYLHPSLLAGKVQQIEKEREASPVVAVDESHPLFKIIEGRKEAERLQKQKQLEAVQAKKELNSTQITVPPPDISQTVKWTAHHLGTVPFYFFACLM